MTDKNVALNGMQSASRYVQEVYDAYGTSNSTRKFYQSTRSSLETIRNSCLLVLKQLDSLLGVESDYSATVVSSDSYTSKCLEAIMNKLGISLETETVSDEDIPKPKSRRGRPKKQPVEKKPGFHPLDQKKVHYNPPTKDNTSSLPPYQEDKKHVEQPSLELAKECSTDDSDYNKMFDDSDDHILSFEERKKLYQKVVDRPDCRIEPTYNARSKNIPYRRGLALRNMQQEKDKLINLLKTPHTCEVDGEQKTFYLGDLYKYATLLDRWTKVAFNGKLRDKTFEQLQEDGSTKTVVNKFSYNIEKMIDYIFHFTFAYGYSMEQGSKELNKFISGMNKWLDEIEQGKDSHRNYFYGMDTKFFDLEWIVERDETKNKLCPTGFKLINTMITNDCYCFPHMSKLEDDLFVTRFKNLLNLYRTKLVEAQGNSYDSSNYRIIVPMKDKIDDERIAIYAQRNLNNAAIREFAETYCQFYPLVDILDCSNCKDDAIMINCMHLYPEYLLMKQIALNSFSDIELSKLNDLSNQYKLDYDVNSVTDVSSIAS